MGLLFNPKMSVYLIVGYPRVSKPSRGVNLWQVLHHMKEGLGWGRGRARSHGQVLQAWGNIMAASRFPSKRGSGLVSMFEWRRKCLVMLSSFSGRSFSLACLCSTIYSLFRLVLMFNWHQENDPQSVWHLWQTNRRFILRMNVLVGCMRCLFI